MTIGAVTRVYSEDDSEILTEGRDIVSLQNSLPINGVSDFRKVRCEVLVQREQHQKFLVRDDLLR